MNVTPGVAIHYMPSGQCAMHLKQPRQKGQSKDPRLRNPDCSEVDSLECLEWTDVQLNTSCTQVTEEMRKWAVGTLYNGKAQLSLDRWLFLEGWF